MTEDFEFRCANDNEMAQFQRLANYVFASPPGDEQLPQLLDPSWTHCAFKKEQLAAISGVFPFIVRLNGKTTPIQGVTAVGTEPEFRRRGLVRRLITDLLLRGKEEGIVGSMLLASRGAIYQRFGYGLASNMVRYEFDPKEATFQFPMEISGNLQRLTKDEALPHITTVFKEYARDRNMLALRAEVVWNRLLSDMDKDKAFCTVHFDDEHKADGYCVFNTKWEAGTDQVLAIMDFAHTTMNAYRAIWQYLCAHDLVGKITWGNVPEDDPAPGILLEPRCLNRKTWDGIWFRVIDVAGLLAARRYDVDGDITIRVEGDDICPWNNGTYNLSARGGNGTVTPSNSADAHIICSVNALASMISGYASPQWLSQIGRISITDPSESGYYNQLFATRHRPVLSFDF